MFVRYENIVFSVLCGLVCGSIILPPEIKTQGPPVCTSLASLCGLDYRYVTDDDHAVQVLHSRNEICSCPNGLKCAIGSDWDNMTNSIVQRMLTGVGHDLLVKISYCQLPEAQARCSFEESVLVTRGRGHFTFDIAENMKCTCRRPLVPKFSWAEGEFDYIQYGCGQRRCSQENTTTCAEVSLKDGDLKNKYFCRCRKQEICTGDVPVNDGESVFHTCRVF